MSDTHAERERRFRDFHQANPHVYQELLALAREAKANGARKIGIRMLWEVMRWNQRGYLATNDPSSSFKLNDHYPPFYARLLVTEHPDLDGLFELRGRASLPAEAIESRRGDVSPQLHGDAPAPPPADTDTHALAASPGPAAVTAPASEPSRAPSFSSAAGLDEAPTAPSCAPDETPSHPPLDGSPCSPGAQQLFSTINQEFDAIAPPPGSPYDTRREAA